MGLDEMLDEYISLKEQRVALDEERRRVEMALQGMQEVLRVYHSAGPAHLPPQPLLPSQFVAVPLTPILPALYSGTSGSPAGKGLFNQPSDCQIDSSPRTPPQALQSQAHDSDSPLDITPLQITDGGNSKQQIVPFNCSIFASETIIVSPIKHAGCCAVERSYHISSPYNLNSKSKRGHIKGKLDFDNPDIETSSEEPVSVDSLTPSTEQEMSGNFELDLPDLDILNGDFSFSELLADINLDSDGHPSFAHSVLSNASHEDDAGNGCSKSDQFDWSSVMPIEVVSDNDANVQGYGQFTHWQLLAAALFPGYGQSNRHSLPIYLSESPEKWFPPLF
ncbi:hypothetical protein B296_00017749 [Ensete ventricosum]|uniref:Uncharacterized protein n=1 Tax=Ensete ventricosum TaxID=4639 RepID=A0A427AQC9_ENSVE|nr:hypothetical protein B296_00017749 [Ensete ventricosum]